MYSSLLFRAVGMSCVLIAKRIVAQEGAGMSHPLHKGLRILLDLIYNVYI